MTISEDNNYLKVNAETWDHRVSIHTKSAFYDVEGFLQGQTSFNKLELSLVGDVTNKRLLHLQCHFGLDTLSWARLGANVTGVDLSGAAITQAKALARQANLEAQFVHKDVYQFGRENTDKFDIVFTSYGVLCWLPNLTQWAEVVAGALKQGGELYLVEFHPFVDLLSGYSYFETSQPDVEQEGTYTENCPGTEKTTVTWPHSISDVVAALIKAGLTIKHLEEHAHSPYNCFDGLEATGKAGYCLKHKGQHVPLLYSIKATMFHESPW